MNFKYAPNSDLLALIGKQELVDLWWKTPNRAFGGSTPNLMYIKNRRIVLEYIAKSLQQ